MVLVTISREFERSQEEQPQFLDKVYYYHNDHLGTPQKLTNDAGEVVWFTDYAPFGYAFGTGEVGVTNKFRFPGQYDDGYLYYNMNRYYNPDTGRYNQVEPASNPMLSNYANRSGNANRIAFLVYPREMGNSYSYARGNPIMFYDENGMVSFWVAYAAYSGAALTTGVLGTYVFYRLVLVPSCEMLQPNEEKYFVLEMDLYYIFKIKKKPDCTCDYKMSISRYPPYPLSSL